MKKYDRKKYYTYVKLSDQEKMLRKSLRDQIKVVRGTFYFAFTNLLFTISHHIRLLKFVLIYIFYRGSLSTFYHMSLLRFTLLIMFVCLFVGSVG